MLTYSSAPLPFMGQKRRFAKEFKQVLLTLDNITTVVDLFGGSGLLSHVAKGTRPELRVVYNDFDNYSHRLMHVERTNKLLAEIRQLVADCPRGKRLPPEVRTDILRLLKQAESKGFVDYVTLSSSVLFSMRYVNNYDELSQETMYNTVKKADYTCDGYLKGLEITHKDYKDLFSEYADCKDVIFIVDPPYLSTEVGSYKSSILELSQWISSNFGMINPFDGSTRRSHKVQMNYNSLYEDIMLYKEMT